MCSQNHRETFAPWKFAELGLSDLKRQKQKLEFVGKQSIADDLTVCCNVVHGVFDIGRAHVRAWRGRGRLAVESLINRRCRHEGANYTNLLSQCSGHGHLMTEIGLWPIALAEDHIHTGLLTLQTMIVIQMMQLMMTRMS